jgi:hypothetical protein
MDGHVTECELWGIFAEPADHAILQAARHAVDPDPARHRNLLSHTRDARHRRVALEQPGERIQNWLEHVLHTATAIREMLRFGGRAVSFWSPLRNAWLVTEHCDAAIHSVTIIQCHKIEK